MSEKAIALDASHIQNMLTFGKNVELHFDGQRLPLNDFVFETRPAIDTSDLVTALTTTKITIEGQVELTDEQQEELSKWWTEVWDRELMRQIMGGPPSEYAESLRASKSKI
jgi:hypothetical protein